MKTTADYVRRKREHGIEDVHVAEALANEADREVQENGRIRVWGYVRPLGRYVRVILLPDGETVHNAFPDRGFKPKQDEP